MLSSIADFASIFSILAVLITIVALIQESKRSRLVLQVDILLKLDEKFHSSEMKSCRQIAAQKIISRIKPNYELEDLLEFFSTIAFLYERKAIDKELTFNQFSYWLNRYYLCSRSYIEEESRKNDPLSYKSLERVAKIFIREELKSGYPRYSENILHSFLIEEKRPTISSEKTDIPTDYNDNE